MTTKVLETRSSVASCSREILYVLDFWKRCKFQFYSLIYFKVYRASTWLSRYISCISFDDPRSFAWLDGHRLATGLKQRSVWLRLALKLRSYQSKEILSLPGEGFPLLLTQKFEMLFSLLVLLISWKLILRIQRIIPQLRNVVGFSSQHF